MAVTVALADDNLIVREGVMQLLSTDPTIRLVAACGDRPSLMRAVAEHDLDVVITGIGMPPTRTDEGIQIAIELRSSHPSIGVVVLSDESDPSYLIRLMDSGSEGRAYLLKDRVHDGRQLRAAIHAVAAGAGMLDPKVVEPLVATRGHETRSRLADLTVREREVLAEIAQGKSNSAIAATMVLTKRAVEKHINSIFPKLGLNDEKDISKRVKATLLFLAEGNGAGHGRQLADPPPRSATRT
jgi:DNA-binding NarL/FixJ family response regulator